MNQAHVQSVDDQARDIKPILNRSGWSLSLGAIAAVIEAMDTMYGPDEVKRLRHIETMALRVASGRRKGIVTDKTALNNLDAALEANKPPDDIQWKDGLPYIGGLLMTYDELVGRLRTAPKANAEWSCPGCGTPLPNSTAVCPTCLPDGMTK